MKHEVNILKKGLKKLQDETCTCKAALEAALKAKQQLSAADEEWIDNAGNLVNEVRIVDGLEKAANYEDAFNRLDSQDKSIVKKLMELAVGDPPGKKGKHMIFENFIVQSLSLLQVLILHSLRAHQPTSKTLCSSDSQARLMATKKRMLHSSKESKS